MKIDIKEEVTHDMKNLRKMKETNTEQIEGYSSRIEQTKAESQNLRRNSN
jgi:hypothetical protein